MMKLICASNEREAGKRAAEIISDVIYRRPNALLGFATGSTPIGMYKELIRMYQSGELSFFRVKTVNLDEYVGLSHDHEQSYAYFMRKNLFDHIDIQKRNTHIPNGEADPNMECEEYNHLLDRLGRVDIQLLGLGHNGHIAFNEPSSHFTKDTTIVRLTDSTISANSRFFSSKSDVPTHAISMGIGRILRSKKILLLVLGRAKAEILERALFGEVTPDVPASILQFYQGDLNVVGDKEAFSVITKMHPDAEISEA